MLRGRWRRPKARSSALRASRAAAEAKLLCGRFMLLVVDFLIFLLPVWRRIIVRAKIASHPVPFKFERSAKAILHRQRMGIP